MIIQWPRGWKRSSSYQPAPRSWADIKRGFLSGLASSLCLGFLFGLVQLSNDVPTAAIILGVSAPSSFLVIRAAYRAPRNRSRGYAVIGWLLGFLAIGAMLLCLFGLVVVFSPWPS